MKDKFLRLKSDYSDNPGWHWLMAIVFLFPILPEYISPFILFIGFIIFKIQWSKEGRKVKIGKLGKLEMFFMGYALLSVLWSNTKLETLGVAGLWWGMFLVQLMIFNLANTRGKIDKLLKLVSQSAAVNGAVATVQICSYALFKTGYISKALVLPTPFYKSLDYKIYTMLPFDIRTNTFDDRASGFFSNPNLLATYMIFAFPISIYLFLNGKSKKQKSIYFIINILISAGMSSTLTRAGCVLALFGWLFMFFVLLKRHYRELLEIFIPTYSIIIPSILMRYGIISINVNFPNQNNEILSPILTPDISNKIIAEKSTKAHIDIWKSVFDYLTSHWNAFFGGLGFGSSSTGAMLLASYNLNKPHAHNFIFEIWMELGLIGIILLFAIIVYAFTMLMVVNSNNGKKFDLVFCVFTSLMLFLLFGLTDYIFNSPKQIILLMILLGITQAINYCYETTRLQTPNDVVMVATRGLENMVKLDK